MRASLSRSFFSFSKMHVGQFTETQKRLPSSHGIADLHLHSGYCAILPCNLNKTGGRQFSGKMNFPGVAPEKKPKTNNAPNTSKTKEAAILPKR